MALRPTALLPCLALVLPLAAAEPASDSNRQPPHALLIPYAARTEALSAKRVSTFARSLEGQWRLESRDGAPASYSRAFEVPATWAGRRVFVRFGGAAAGFSLRVNGNPAGSSADARVPSEFDITAFVNPGQNTMAVETQAAGGIFGTATIWSAPQVHIRDLFVRADPDALCRDGLLVVTARVRNDSGKAAPARLLSVDLSALGGRIVAAASVQAPPLEANGETAVSLAIPVLNPVRWSAERPELYTAVVTLGGGPRGQPSEVFAVPAGFRRVEMSGVEMNGPALAVNGVSTELKTAARPGATSSESPVEEAAPGGRQRLGPAKRESTPADTAEARMRREIEALKQANANFVRASGTEDPRWYDLCDLYGLYVVADASEASFQAYKNHPSVVAWSPIEEGDVAGAAALRKLRGLDPWRPAQFFATGATDCGKGKLACQWIAFEAEDVAAGKVLVRNRYSFTNLSRLAGTWSITRDGDTVAHGVLAKVDVAPGAAGVVKASWPKIVPRPGSEYRLRIAFSLARNEIWAKAGYEVAAEEFVLPLEWPASSPRSR